MAVFHFVAINATGQEQKGVIEAETDKHARQLLRDRSLTPLSIKSSQRKSGLPTISRHQSNTRLSAKDLALITRQFATLLSAGLPIEEALLAVSEQTEKPQIKALVLSVRSKVVEGHALAPALQEHPQAFTTLYAATVAAGESTGHLDLVLLRLADYTEQQWQLNQKLKMALIYPSLIIMVALGIVAFLLEFVVPKMVAVYGNLHQTLPGLTQLLISISDGVKSYGIYILILMIGGGILFRYYYRRNRLFRSAIQSYLLLLPIIGPAMRTAETARFTRTLSILTASGVPALEAMQIAAQLLMVVRIQEAVRRAVTRVGEGTSINQALKQTAYFTPMSLHMIASGEASGKLEDMLERVAKNQEEDIVRLIDVSLALFEPAIIIVMGAIVLFIVLAVLLPIFQLDTLG